jgi:hypothetical protein
MLRPIPAKILTHTATLRQCAGVDVWQEPSYTDTTLSRICVQPTHDTRLTKDDTEVALTSIAFIDARLSSPPGFDFAAAQDESEANGQPLAFEFNGRRYTVVTVDTLCDDHGGYHHTELGLR